MSKITLTNVVNLQNENTAVNAINTNNAVLETASNNTLSRDGTAPNQMQAALDMNSNRILNLPAPVQSTDVVRFQDLPGVVVPVTTLPVPSTTSITFDTKALAAAANLNSSFQTIITLGYTSVADSGGSMYKKLGGPPSEVTPAQFQTADGAWWQLAPVRSIYTPEMFGAKGDGVTSDSVAINAMFEYVPYGATCLFSAKNYRVTKTAGTSYGIRLRKSIKMLGTLSGGAGGTSAIVYDNTFDSLTNVFLIQVPGNSVTPNSFAFYGLEIGCFYFVPFAASLGFQLTLFTWDPTKEYCLYAKDVVHFDLPNTFGGAEILDSWIHDLYIFGSGGPGGGQGIGVSLNIDCDPVTGGWFGNIVERIHTSGGILLTQIGDSNTFRDILMDGKSGLEYTVKSGAVETVFENFNSVCLNQAVYGHGGSKITFRNWNAEQHGAQVNRSPDLAIFDIRNDIVTTNNGITFDGLTIGDQTFTTGGAGTQYSSFIYIDNCISPIFKRCNFYSSQPGGGPFASEAIRLNTNTSYAKLIGPFTRQSSTTIPILVNDFGVGNYGVEETLTGNANATATLNAALWTGGSNLTFRKTNDGFVCFSGFLTTVGAFTNGTVLTMPVGFRPITSFSFTTATNGGSALVTINASGVLTMNINTGGGATQLYLNNVCYKEINHDTMITGN